ncbi:hypothetical protein CYB_1035 [Synechococcus sp. JA-2-3B'a(2-13)]|nr:hypothetical protein CYB_1035 [Synechococcus sp. JA-2-3B'a(2-13)]
MDPTLNHVRELDLGKEAGNQAIGVTEGQLFGDDN